MPYRLVFDSELARILRTEWGLSDELLIDVYLRLDQLRTTPARLLRRKLQPVDGMAYEFELTEPGNRLILYSFVFLVRYGDSEETLHIVRGGCARTEAS